MARKRITIDEKIELQKAVVSKAKDKYDAELDKLNMLMQKREESRRKELMDASFIWLKALKFQGLFEIDLHQIKMYPVNRTVRF